MRANPTISGRCRSSQRRSRPLKGHSSGKNGTKWNRRLKAASMSAIDRSAVFMVPTISRPSGSEKRASPFEYIRATSSSRYSKR